MASTFYALLVPNFFQVGINPNYALKPNTDKVSAIGIIP